MAERLGFRYDPDRPIERGFEFSCSQGTRPVRSAFASRREEARSLPNCVATQAHPLSGHTSALAPSARIAHGVLANPGRWRATSRSFGRRIRASTYVHLSPNRKFLTECSLFNETLAPRMTGMRSIAARDALAGHDTC